MLMLVAARLQNYRDHSDWVKKYVGGRPSTINFKVYEDGIKVKIKKDLFVLIKKDTVETIDCIIKKVRIPNTVVAHWKDVPQLLRLLDKYFDNPDLITKIIVSRHNPLVVGKYKIGNRVLRTEDGDEVNVLRKSEIHELERKGLSANTSAKVYEIRK